MRYYKIKSYALLQDQKLCITKKSKVIGYYKIKSYALLQNQVHRKVLRIGKKQKKHT